jgi:hypothetical protein
MHDTRLHRKRSLVHVLTDLLVTVHAVVLPDIPPMVHISIDVFSERRPPEIYSQDTLEHCKIDNAINLGVPLSHMELF